MSRHWFPPHSPNTAVNAVLCMLYCGIASVYYSSRNVRTKFYVMFRPDSYYVLNAAIPCEIFICFKHCKVLCTPSIMFTYLLV